MNTFWDDNFKVSSIWGKLSLFSNRYIYILMGQSVNACNNNKNQILSQLNMQFRNNEGYVYFTVV